MYVFFSLIFFVSCKRVPIENLNETSEVKNAKEWYYGTFKKSDTYKVSSEAAAQLPDWKYGKHRKSGNLEIIEFPLNKARKSFAISSKGYSINQITDIANGSVSRVAFIKTDGKEFILREIDYIPDFEYLKEKEYDISDIELGANIKNFSGYVAIKNWGGSIINTYKFENGKIVKTKVKVDNSNIFLSRRGAYDCQPGEDCMYIRWCETELIGDTWYYTGECTQWENTGECWQTDECDGIPPSDCALYGVDCGNNGGGGNDESESPCAQAYIDKFNDLTNATQTSEDISTNLIDIDPLRKYRNTRWRILKGVTWSIASQETGIVKLVDPNTIKWVWESLTHQSISFEGFSLGGSVTPLNAVGTPSFVAGTPNILYAGMSVNFNVKYTPASCDDCPVVNAILVPLTKNYTSTSSLWPAKR